MVGLFLYVPEFFGASQFMIPHSLFLIQLQRLRFLASSL